MSERDDAEYDHLLEGASKMAIDLITKDAEIARLKAQRDRLAIDHRTILSARMPTGFADTALAERFGLRIVGGQVEEVE